MSTHTPGPWTISRNIHGEAFIEGIAEIFGLGRIPNANAALIASAPDLLAALYALDAWLIAPDLSLGTIESMREVAKGAIAKANGEA